MKKLSEFLTEHLQNKGFAQELYSDVYMLDEIENGIEAYKKHLKEDSPKTVQWAMHESELIIALERMESVEHSELDKTSDEIS